MYERQHPLDPGNGIPIFIAPGVLKYPAQLEQFMSIKDPLSAPVLSLGGFTMNYCSGLAKAGESDFVYNDYQKLAGNARGLPNDGKDGILNLKPSISKLNKIGIKTILQVSSLPNEDPLTVLPELCDIAASVNPTVIEIDFSCPNINSCLPLTRNPEYCVEILNKVREKIGFENTLQIKDDPHVSKLEDKVNETEILKLSKYISPLIDSVVGINTIGNQNFPELTCNNGVGGASGPAIASIAKQHLRIWKIYAPDIPYLSVGGVDSDNARYEINERIKMGAMLVGGAQEFYRTKSQINLAARWAIEYVS